MKMGSKPDAALFRQHLENLKKETWLGEERSWWPRFLFHFADINNVVSILKNGELLSRLAAKKQNDFVDSASPEIIARTGTRRKDNVRFYLRPRTPMLYSIEGFRPLGRWQYNAHCPMPIYLLYDFESIICRDDSSFSYGSLAHGSAEVYKTAEAFMTMPFKFIYHEGSFHQDERDKIIFHRHAEVIVPKSVGLEDLNYIWCRSQAEYETLHYLLPDEVWSRWRDKIFTRTDFNLFNRRWIYVDKVTLTDKQITFNFNPALEIRDQSPFRAELEIYETFTGKRYVWTDGQYVIPRTNLVFSLANMTRPNDYTVTLLLDGNIAYKNRYQALDIPF